MEYRVLYSLRAFVARIRLVTTRLRFKKSVLHRMMLGLLLVLPLLIVCASRIVHSTGAAPAVSESNLAEPDDSTKIELARRYGDLPLSFEVNEGQSDQRVKFISHGPGYNLFLTGTGAVLSLRNPTERSERFKAPDSAEQPLKTKTYTLQLQMIGANPAAQVEGQDELPGKVNYFVGNDPENWHLNIPTYREVRYEEIYPGIDLIYYGNRKDLEFDFAVAPGANPRAIRLRFDGADRMKIDAAGDLLLKFSDCKIRMHKPLIYQPSDQGGRREVKGRYVIKGNEVKFDIAGYDSAKPLIIDPVISYGTLLGSGGNENAYGIAVDPSGSAYITGVTGSNAFPTTPGAFQTTSNSGSAFVSKLNPAGSDLVYSTYLSGANSGGVGTTTGWAIAVDPSGSAYVTGATTATDFPLLNPLRGTTNLLRTIDAGANWVGKNFNPPRSVSSLVVDPQTPSTVYAGTSGGSGVYKSIDSGDTWTALNTGLGGVWVPALAIDPITPSTIYGVTNTPTFGVIKSTNGGANWSSVGGVSGTGIIYSLAIDPVSPSTLYFGSNGGLFKTTNGGNSWTRLNNFPNVAFTIAVDPTAPATLYAGGGAMYKSTDGGTNWSSSGNGLPTTGLRTLAIDPTNTATIYVGTNSGLYKSIDSGASWSNASAGIGSASVVSLVINGSSPATLYAGITNGKIFKTVNGGTNWNTSYLTLFSTSINALAINPASPSTVHAGTAAGFSPADSEAFLTKLNPAGSGLVYSTFLGGSGADVGYGVALDSALNAYVTGQTTSGDFMTANPVQSTLLGSADAFVTKVNSSGSALLYSTYLGGSASETGFGIAADSSGNAYVTGSTNSANFPTAGAFQSTLASQFDPDAFVTKLNGAGALSYSTYLGGNFMDTAYGIAVDSSGSAYVTGSTNSSNFPTSNAIQPTLASSTSDAFVTKLNNAGSALVYSTYLGGVSIDSGRGIAVDSANNAYIAGHTSSGDFPTVAGSLRSKSPLFMSSNGGASWSNDNNGLKSEVVTALALNPSTPSTVYAGTRSGVFKSTNNGRTWSLINNGLALPNVSAIVVDPVTPTTVYLAASFSQFSSNAGVYKSIDGGSSWSPVNNGLGNGGIQFLAIDPLTPSTLYALWPGGIFKTTNGGGVWSPVGPSIFGVERIVVDPVTPTTLYATTSSSGGNIYKSIDGGANWQLINNGLTTLSVRTAAVDPVTPSTIYAGTNGGIFKSVDAGGSWTPINTGLTNVTVSSIAIDPTNTSTIYVAGGGFGSSVFKTTNGGSSWTAVSNGLTYSFFSAIVINPLRPSTVYVGVNVFPPDQDAFVTKINAAGNSFAYSTLLGGFPASGDSSSVSEVAFAIALDSAGNAYVAGLSRSPDFPVTPDAYQPFNRGFDDAFVVKLIMSYTISGQVLDGANAPVSDVEVTANDGATLASVFTESDGSFQFSRLREGGNFTVTAAKAHFTMTPPSYSFTNLNSNQTANFTATATSAPFYTVSGQVTENGVGLAGVVVTATGSQSGVRTTDANGNYSFELAGGGNYTVTPTAPLGLSFNPPSQTFNNLGANQTANFAITRQSFVVVNTNNHGVGSLRQAILNANALPGLDTIVFNIPGPGVQVINLLIPLPEITDPVVIDATTQPGFAGLPLIELNGAQAGSNAGGFRITAGNSTIRGFAIGRFTNGSGIFLGTNGGNTIQGNFIGLDATGESARPTLQGIAISNSNNNLIGGATPSARNVVSANSFYGITVAGANNQIQGNYIGTNASGTAARPNGINGVEISGSPTFTGNLVGGTTPGAGNLISGNQRGVNLFAPGNTVQGNLIGTDASGTQKIGNGTGVYASAPNSVVGGTTPAARNIISGNNGDGVTIGGAGSLLQGNYIGTDITGTLTLGNGGSGVVAGNSALVGGTNPAARNIISGNAGFGNISLGSNSSGDNAIVQGNYIGTDVTGNLVLNNPAAGIVVFGLSNIIGGTTPGARNVISGNAWAIQMGGFTTATLTGNIIQGNLIGTNAGGTLSLPNTLGGIQISGTTNNTLIGGSDPAASNQISFNGGPAVRITSGTGNEIRGNSIFANAGMGIDIGSAGVTANDNCDGDSGANTLQNFPVVTSAISNATTTTIQGTLGSTPSTQFRIDFFSNQACDASGNGEGQTYLGSTTVNTDASCNASFNFTVPNANVNGSIITAVATNPAGNTSEFSKCTRVVSTVEFSAGSYSVNEGDQFATITVNRTGDISGPATIKYATSDATDVNFNCNPSTAGQITGVASRKCDYHIAAGRLRFAAGEASKQIIISLVNDVYVEGPETLTITLVNPSDASVGGTATATVTINDDANETGPNPIDGTAFYVRMLYVDLLSREPEPAGLAGWIHRIDFCGQPGEPPPPCDRVTVGGDGFLRSAEFFDREFFVIRLYRTGLGRIPHYDDVGDLAYVSGFLTSAELELNKQELVSEIMSRPEFGNTYNALSNAQFVDTLLQTAAVTVPTTIRDGWVNALNSTAKTRAVVFREISERPEVSNKYLHEAQVVSCYYGFFTRNPDGAYLNYLQRLDSGEINLSDLANAFINAAEYRQRFGP